jgi:hypothetical protein
MESTIKTLTITGSAASTPDVKPRRGITKRKSKPEEESEEPETQNFVAETKPIIIPRQRIIKPVVPAHAHAPAAVPVIPKVHAPVIVQPQVQQPQVQPQVQAQPKPKEITSVTLNPPKARVKLMPKTPIKPVQVNQTRKVRRVQLPNLSNRITRAKKIYSETKKTPIDTIKNYLIQKGVIQAKSKAPESMLRSMYGDFNMLKDGHAL